ncbi:MAG: Fis family transcriptional regulator [Gemmatimonadota bacterium]
MAEVFSRSWAEEWCLTLNSSESYRGAATAWEGSVALVMTRDASARSPQRAIFLDLWHGECRGARVATDQDLDEATYVLSGLASSWRDVLTGRLAPLMAVMGGKIRLTRGSIASLVPYAAAARELVTTATEMENVFPEGWGD